MIDDKATPDAGHRHRMEAGKLSEAIAAFASDLPELGHVALTIAGYEC